jgi:hypothetical protein
MQMADETAAPAPAGPAPAAPIKAWKTSEFWLTTLSQLVGTAMTVCGMLGIGPNSKIMLFLGIGATLLASTGHQVSRTIIKTAGLLLLCLGLSACCAGGGAPLKTEVDSENALMAELSAYIQADPKKSDDLKKAEAAKIKAHLDLFNSLIQK